ncbi:hypothetical protein [Arcticibacter tournemirensis]|uniref:CHAP domain-containing protein n=1 Tax=Arcticibacter tournemirensis TaxID=699437 RepID=A0A4Q0M446_9SPHI|nr:hypothetical protein [Arcticibacter tournemirensis]RXF67710.1 hypothetical protein EKH83_17935 [Arcticibacter tournemirensis]
MKTIISFILLGSVALWPATHNLQQIYTAELGVREATGRNDGNSVEGYLRYVGLKKGDPWCAAFVCYCLGKAGIANPRTGYCPVLFAREKVIWTRGLKVEGSRLKVESGLGAESGKQKVEGSRLKVESAKPSTCDLQNTTHNSSHNSSRNPSCNPSSGDVFGIYFPEKGRIAHVGFVDEWGDKYAITVEGNTNEAGSREGDGVYRKRRLISSIYKVARYP